VTKVTFAAGSFGDCDMVHKEPEHQRLSVVHRVGQHWIVRMLCFVLSAVAGAGVLATVRSSSAGPFAATASDRTQASERRGQPAATLSRSWDAIRPAATSEHGNDFIPIGIVRGPGEREHCSNGGRSA
jgi:hypothetical protein